MVSFYVFYRCRGLSRDALLRSYDGRGEAE